MKLKKMLVFCASLALVSSCANLPVSAEAESITVVVYGTGGKADDPLKSWYDVMGEHNLKTNLDRWWIEKYSPSTGEIQLGDILTCEGMEWAILETSPGTTKICLSSDDVTPNISVTGSVFDNPETATYKVENFEITETPYGSKTYHVLNCDLVSVLDETKSFPVGFCFEQNVCTPPDCVDWATLQTGDIVSCITYNECPVFVAEKLSATPSGDADGNGTLDILDVISVNKAVLGKENLDPERIPYIDFNSNSIPDSDDALTMLKKIVGLG